MSDTDKNSNTIKVTDLVQRSLDELNTANRASDPQAAARHMQSSRIFADLSESQGIKTGNIIAYLNSDRGGWSEEDESVVRTMLGLHPLTRDVGEGDGGVEDLDFDKDPVPPMPASEPDFAVAPDVEPAVEHEEMQEPSFA